MNSEVNINLSIGYSFSEDSINKMDNLFKIADTNMYRSKRSKKII